VGQLVNGYDLIEPFQNHNAGFSRWTYARQRGKVYFLKEFMDPIYPDDAALSETLRKNRIADCKLFQDKKVRLYEAVNKASDGNITRICEFFRWDSHYYISTDWIEGDKITLRQLAGLPMIDRMLLCRSLAHSLMRLHRERVVHSDIKETNVIIKRTRTGSLTGKLIDFDCSFLETEPPENEDDLGGDQIYLAPECCMFMCGEDVPVGCKSDVFSAGILFHQYLTGELPWFNHGEYDYAHEAVLEGEKLKISPALPDWIRSIIEQMLVCDQDERISMEEVYKRLGAIFGDTGEVETVTTTEPEDAEPEGIKLEDIRKVLDNSNRGSNGGGWFGNAGEL